MGLSIVGLIYLALVVILVIRVFKFLHVTIKYFENAGNEQKLMRFEVSKIAEELQQLNKGSGKISNNLTSQ